jgi:hypothetical protein
MMFKKLDEAEGIQIGLELPENQSHQLLPFLLDDVFHIISALCNPCEALHSLLYATSTRQVFPALVNIFEKIRGQFVSMSQKAEEDDADDVFYTKDANILKSCFSLILQLFSLIFTCDKLKLAKNRKVLMATLRTLIHGELPRNAYIGQTATVIIENSVSFEKNVKSIDCALSLARSLQTIANLANSDIHFDFVVKTVDTSSKSNEKRAESTTMAQFSIPASRNF